MQNSDSPAKQAHAEAQQADHAAKHMEEDSPRALDQMQEQIMLLQARWACLALSTEDGFHDLQQCGLGPAASMDLVYGCTSADPQQHTQSISSLQILCFWQTDCVHTRQA